MQPEISRRCLVCGASPRAGAQFCPQCGSSLSARGADVTNEAVADAGEVERAFETWRGGEAQAEPRDARMNEPPREVKTSEPTTTPPTRSAAGFEPEAGGVLMKEPLAGRSESVAASSASPSEVAGEVDEGSVGDAPSSFSSSSSSKIMGATRRRAASVVKESIAPRVERVRDRSMVMLEDAPTESGLRFVVIAAALFALFVLMLVLSTVIK